MRREERDGMGGYLRGGLHKGWLHIVEGQYSKWKLVQTLFLIILFGRVSQPSKKNKKGAKFFFCIKKEGRRGRLGVDREEGLIREGVYWKPSHVRKGKPTVNK